MSNPRRPCVAALCVVFLSLASCSGNSSSAPAQSSTAPTGVPFRRQEVAHPGGQHELLDVDADGDLDIVQANQSTVRSPQNLLLRNDGDGRFAEGKLPEIREDTRCLAIGDFDGDGSTDFVTGNRPGPGSGENYYYRNNGSGEFSAVALPGPVQPTIAVAAGDVDGDGDLDLVFGNDGAGLGPRPNQLFLNDGTGKFSFSRTLGPATDPTSDIALADFNGDGALDIVLANATRDNSLPDRLLLGDGAGNFQDSVGALPQRVKGLESGYLCVGDLDRDGDLDVIVARAGHVWLNDGTATFRSIGSTAGSYRHPLLADVNDDGILDLSLTASSPQMIGTGNIIRGGFLSWTEFVLLGNGKGQFALAEPWLLPSHEDASPHGGSRAGDLDGDGDTDFIAPGGQGLILYRNLTRDVHADNEPAVGKPWSLEIRGHATLAKPGQFALPWLGIARLEPKVRVETFGLWGLRPAGSIALPGVQLASPSGSVKFDLPIPQTPGLVGSQLYVQALLLHETRRDSWRFTNVHRGTIR